MFKIRLNQRSIIQILIYTILIVTLVIIAFQSDKVEGQTTSPLQPYTKVKLENGLTLIVKEVHAAPIAAVDIWVATGSKNEPPDIAGISHFFEHMLFKGTTKRQMGQISKEIKAVGGYTNAQTSLDTTHYYVVVPSEKINLALDIEADAIMNSTFDPAEIDRERKVILEEKRLKEDDPQGRLGLMAYQNAFKGTPYANDVLGTAETLAKINQQTFVDYYRKYYIPNNMAVTVVGDVNTTDIIRQVKALFKDFKAQKKPTTTNFQIPKLTKVVKVEAEMPVDQTYLFFSFPGPNMTSKDEPALSILSVILGGGESSRLNQELLEKKRIVNSIAAGYNSYQKIGMLAIYAQTQNNPTGTIEDEVKAVIRELIENGVTETELARAKAIVRSDIAYAMESDADIAGIIGEYQVGGDVTDAEKSILGLQNVTVKDIQRVAKTYLNLNGYVMSVVKPQEVKGND